MPEATAPPSPLVPGRAIPSLDDVSDEIASHVQGLSPQQLAILAVKVYDLLLEELRIESERHGGIGHR